MTKRYAPHAKGWPGRKDMSPPPPPPPSHPPPQRSQLWEMKVTPSYDMDNIQTLENGSPRVTFETRFDKATELDDVADLASRRQDSGISELSDSYHSKRGKRPYSQASSDSDDSGFRSSRSAHYLQKYDHQLSTFQDVPLLRSISHGKREEVNRSPISFSENVQITDYLAPTNLLFHPCYGDVSGMPKTDIGSNMYSGNASPPNPNIPTTDYNPMVSAGFLQLGGPSLTTTAMVHSLSDDNDQKVYSVV